MKRALCFLFLVLLLTLTSRAAQPEVLQPAGAVPLLHEVDVVVVGGSSGGVAAAVEAAKSGAKVFLAAPRPYLGEDLCATYRLWLEPGEQPTTDLAKEVFKATPVETVPFGPGLPFKYSTDVPSARQHRDTATTSLLNDGKWHNAPSQSVQYDGDVTLSIDLGREQSISRLTVLAYQRNADFEVDTVTVSASADQQQWVQVAVLKNPQLGQGQFEDTALPITAPAAAKARYLKLAVKRGPEAKRVLLGEIVVKGDDTAPPSPAATTQVTFTTPMQVKRTLDQALVKSGVPFLFGSYVTDILRDAQGKPAGVVIANRSGRQAIVARAIIDATERAVVARMAGAEFSPYPQETQVFSRVVVGGPARMGESLSLRARATPLSITDRKGDLFPVHEYQVLMPMLDGSFASFAAAEQLARDWSWSKDAVDASEVMFQVPPDSFRSAQPQSGEWPGAERLSLDCLQPAGVERIHVLGGCADLSREAAAKLMRPVNLMAIGGRLGKSVAEKAKQQPKLERVRVAGSLPGTTAKGEVRETLAASHRTGTTTVPEELHGVPVLGEYDVIVVGGGTGGAPAAIAAGRQGARTLLIEYLHGLGGVGTLGYIASYYHGNICGFTKEFDAAVAALGETNSRTSSRSWNPEHKSEAYRRELRKAGVEIWYGTQGHGAVVEDGRVTGVVVLTPHGRGVVKAKVVVDSTGNADIAAAAGAPCRYTDETDVSVQGTGLPPRELGQKYTNTDYTFVDDNDVFDLWRVMVTARVKFKNAYDLGQLIDTRERRQIIGDATLSPMDMVLGRTHPDTVVIARSNFDTHGYIVHPMFMLRPPHREDIDVRVPYRCLLPRGLDGILVTGLGVSAHRDALPCIRMQADVQNQGYAAGVAAAMIAKQGKRTRDLDIRALQQHLVEIGNLPKGILTETDSFPLPTAKVAAAVKSVAKDYDGLEIVLAQFDAAQPLLRAAYRDAFDASSKLIYAHILGMMGDATGAETLAQVVSTNAWDKGWRYTGMGQFGACMSPLDSWIISLGRTKSPAALKPILEKASLLQTDAEFSHFRAVSIALETIGEKSAVKPLAQLLRQPGLSGHAVTTIDAAMLKNPPSGTDNTTRNLALSELYLARALYRCGDDGQLGERILRQYAQDLHGYYARHALAVLNAKR